MIHRRKALGIALVAAGAGLLFGLVLQGCAAQILLGLGLLVGGLLLTSKC